jgi:hypothetical protein
MSAKTYWWCLEHKRVETNGGCGSTTRIGPYDSADEAAKAVERTRARAAEQDAKDREDKDP